MTITDFIIENITDIINANSSAIEEELKTNPEGRLTLSVPVKLAISGPRVSGSFGCAYSRKFKDEIEAAINLPDPNQPELIKRDDDDPPHIQCGPVEITVNKPKHVNQSKRQ